MIDAILAENAIDCSSFFDDPGDVELYEIADFLLHIAQVDDVRAHCRHWRDWCKAHSTSAPPPSTINSNGQHNGNALLLARG